ncbi:DUF397 domain-containing protein [Streptomyces sioyaensis]
MRREPPLGGAAARVRHVRDSKEPGGSQLAFTRAAWAGFVAETGRSRIN